MSAGEEWVTWDEAFPNTPRHARTIPIQGRPLMDVLLSATSMRDAQEQLDAEIRARLVNELIQRDVYLGDTVQACFRLREGEPEHRFEFEAQLAPIDRFIQEDGKWPRRRMTREEKQRMIESLDLGMGSERPPVTPLLPAVSS